MSACLHKNLNLRGRFRKRRLTNTPRRNRLADGRPYRSTHPYHVSARLAPPLVMCFSACAVSSKRTVHPRIGLVVSTIFIRRFCDPNKCPFIVSTRFNIVLKSGLSFKMDRMTTSSPPVSVSLPDSIANLMASSHHFSPLAKCPLCLLYTSDAADE